MFDEYERKANEKIDSQYTDECRRVRIRKRYYDDSDVLCFKEVKNSKLKLINLY